MTLEELISALFKADETLKKRLAQYMDVPAVFMQSAPADTQQGWGETGQYPRIVYTVDMRADSERKTAGTVRVDLLCDVTGTLPEELEHVVIDCMKDLIVQPDGGSPYCFAWGTKQGFELESSSKSNLAEKRIVGTEMLFNILEYPEQITADPDPVYTMNLFLKERLPDAFVLGIDSMSDHFKRATEDEPVLYVRLIDTGIERMTFGIAWMKCTLSIHIIAPDSAARTKWARVVLNALAQKGEAIMPDKSVMLFGTTRANNAFDYLSTGQVTLEAVYTIPRIENLGNPMAPAIRKINTK